MNLVGRTCSRCIIWSADCRLAGSLCALTIKDHFLLSQRPFKAQCLHVKSMNCLWQPMSEFICNIRCTSSQNIDFIDTICLWPFIHEWHYSVPPDLVDPVLLLSLCSLDCENQNKHGCSGQVPGHPGSRDPGLSWRWPLPPPQYGLLHELPVLQQH